MRCRFTLWLIISSLQFTFSQVNYFVIPKLGIANPLSSSFQSDDEFFKINALNISPTTGLSLGFITSKGLCFNGGIHVGHTSGIVFKYGNVKRDLTEARSVTEINTIQLNIQIQKSLIRGNWFKSKKREKLSDIKQVNIQNEFFHLLNFNLKALGGFSYNHLVKHSEEDEVRKIFYGTMKYTVANRNSFSLLTGFVCEFNSYNKRNFQLTVWYSQGLSTALRANVKYKLLNADYSANVTSRGSFFCVELGYPIYFYKKEKQN